MDRLWMDRLRQNVRYAVRGWRRAPGLIAAALVSLALGMGATTAIFSLMDAVLLRPLPVAHPEELVQVGGYYTQGFGGVDQVTWATFQHLRENNHVLSSLVGTAPNPGFYVGTEGRDLERVAGSYVTGDFFPTLGLRPAAGRLLSPADDRMGDAAPVAVVSWRYWNSRFQLDPGVVGREITIQGTRLTIVGVAPRTFVGVRLGTPEDLWLPTAMEPAMELVTRTNSMTRSNVASVAMLGRLRPGVPIERARAELSTLFREVEEGQLRVPDDPQTPRVELRVEPAAGGVGMRVREQFGQPLRLVMAIAGALLLMACANVAGLLLARGAAREREMAVRMTVGAGRFGLLRMVLVESILLAGVGGLAGALLAYSGAGVLVRILGSGRQPVVLQVQPDSTVLLFTLGVTLLAGLLFGLAPALRAWHTHPAAALREMGRSGETRSRRLFGQGLVAGQVALSVVLLSAAGLFGGHLVELYRIDLGFEPHGLLLVTLDPAGRGYDRQRLERASRELLERFDALPGVRSTTTTGAVPISGAGASRHMRVEGAGPDAWDDRFIPINWVGPRYFETLGTALLAGREFDAEEGSTPVAIVNRTFAEHYFPGRSPLGRRVVFQAQGPGEDEPYEIVGLVDDAKYLEITEEIYPTVYLSSFQAHVLTSRFGLRVASDPAAVGPAVRAEIREVLPDVPVSQMTTLDAVVDASIVPERLVGLLSGLFGGIGVVLAAAGLYGLLAYRVARRVGEIGVRMALGAAPARVVRMVLGEALGMVLVGAVVGGVVAWWGGRFAGSVVAGLEGVGWPVVLGVGGMLGVAVVAAVLPARRAARVDPAVALRVE